MTVCLLMVKCVYGCPELICKSFPVSIMTSPFLANQSLPVNNTANHHRDGHVFAISFSGHQTNRSEVFSNFKFRSRQTLAEGRQYFIV